MRQAKAKGHKLARRSAIIRAQQCRLLPTPDPLESGTTLGNPPTEPILGMGTTPLLRSSRGEPARSETGTQQETHNQELFW